MSVYVFSLLVGYYVNGIDLAQARRCRYLKKLAAPVKYIYTKWPSDYFVSQYRDFGISIEDTIVAQYYVAGYTSLASDNDIQKKTHELMNTFGADEIKREGKAIHIYRDGFRQATIKLGEDSTYYHSIEYYNEERLLARECYLGDAFCTEYFVTAQNANGLYAKSVKRTFRTPEGKVAFDIYIGEDKEELYVFPDGREMNSEEFLCLFMDSLNLSKEDVLLVDRPAGLTGFMQPLFSHARDARIITFLHSRHYYVANEDDSAIFLNYEYYYWFKYADKIDTMIVSTEPQAKELEECLIKYGCSVPRIVVIPINGIDKLRYPVSPRRPHSLITASRLVYKKRVDLIIRAVILAHKEISDITLDIYGTGDDIDIKRLQGLIDAGGANHYIRLMGEMDVQELYVHYDAYISASLGETLGLSLLEAAASGEALIGLDAKYGNQVFIEHGENGYRVDFDPEVINQENEQNALVNRMAEAVCATFSNDDILSSYQKKSYDVASRFMDEKISESWITFFNEFGVQ